MAEREGANGVSVITPYFIMPSQLEIIDHYRRIAENTSLPVVLYSNPSTCGGLKIEPETVAKLSAIKNIVAIKDSSGDLQNAIETVRLTPDDFAVLMGRDTLIAPALMFGAKGAVPASGNIAPKLVVEIYESFRAGNIERCKSAQARLSPVRIALTMGTAPGVVKQAMSLIGWDVGPSRVADRAAERRETGQVERDSDDGGAVRVRRQYGAGASSCDRRRWCECFTRVAGHTP